MHIFKSFQIWQTHLDMQITSNWCRKKSNKFPSLCCVFVILQLLPLYALFPSSHWYFIWLTIVIYTV